MVRLRAAAIPRDSMVPRSSYRIPHVTWVWVWSHETRRSKDSAAGDHDERRQILPFFRARRHLSAFVATSGEEVDCYDRIAFEYPLFGDFSCDLVVGDSAQCAYCLIEFEDAGPTSVFIPRGKRVTRYWSPRFERGYSQVIDRFHKLDDMRRSDDLISRFGNRTPTFSGVLVIGRDQYLKAGERERAFWRRANVVVGSQRIWCVTFDALVEKLESRLATFLDADKSDV